MTVPSGEVTVLMSWPRFVEAGRVNLMTAGTATTHRSRTVAIHRSGDAVPRAQAHHRSSPPWRDLAASASLLVRIRMLVPSDAACSSGASANIHLADRGIPLVLVDQDWPGHAASPLSFASISAFGKDPLAYYELARGGMVSWARWDRRLGGVGYRRTGEVRWTSDPQEGRDLAERVTRARQRGYPVVPS